MSRTLQQCKALLRKGGLLIANELSAKTDFLTLTFGLTDGWWLFDDAEVRIPGSPIISRYSTDLLQAWLHTLVQWTSVVVLSCTLSGQNSRGDLSGAAPTEASCKMCREGWMALLSEQGFENVVALGEADTAPALLQRQSVIAGLSNGEILVKPPPTQPAQLRSTMPPLASDLLRSFAAIPLRDSLVPGE